MGLFCLGFTRLLEPVDLYLLLDLGRFQALFLQMPFESCALSPPQDSREADVEPLFVSAKSLGHDPFFNLFCLSDVQIEEVFWIRLQGYCPFPLSS